MTDGLLLELIRRGDIDEIMDLADITIEDIVMQFANQILDNAEAFNHIQEQLDD